MAKRILITALCGLAACAAAQADGSEVPRDFDSALLYAADGRAWLAMPLIHLGMIGVVDQPPVCLSADVQRQLAPLITRVDRPPASRDPWWFGRFPETAPDRPVVLLGLRVRMTRRDVSSPAMSRPGGRGTGEVSEIIDAEVRNIEFVPCEWREAWIAANEGLQQIIQVSRTAPDSTKRQRLEAAVVKTAEALQAMEQARAREEWLEMASQAAPKARVIRLFQWKTRQEWQHVLENCTRRLNLPLPASLSSTPRLDAVALLAESESAADLAAKLRAGWPECLLEEHLMYSQEDGRFLYIRDALELSPTRFDALKAKAVKMLKERRTRTTSEPVESQPAAVEPLKITIRAAEPELLAAKLILGGLVVTEVSEHRSGAALQSGDVILDYQGTYELAMPKEQIERSATWLANLANRGGKITVLRGEEILTVEFPKGAGSSGR